MHLGFIVPGSLVDQSGGFLYDRMLVEQLRRRGWQVDVIPFPSRGYAGDLQRTLLRQGPPGLDPGSLDLLLEDELSHPALLSFNRWIRRRTDLPIVAVVHHLRSSEARPAWMNAFYRWVEQSYLADVDAAVCNSEATRSSVRALWTALRPSIVAYPGRGALRSPIDAGTVRTRALRPGPLKLIFLGNIIPRKGLLNLLAALSALSESDWELQIVGDTTSDPPHMRRIRRFLAREGLTRRVAFLGRLDDASLHAHLAEAQLMAMPSDHEGFGIAYLDGMAYGLPALATSAGGAGELVRHGHNGLLVAPGDPNALRSALARLIQDRYALAEMGVAALDTYRAHPTWTDSVELVRTFFLHFKKKAGTLSLAGSPFQRHTTVGGSA